MEEIGRVVDELGAAPVGASVLGWDRLRELHAEGLTLASHSATHALLQRVPLDRAVDDVATSLADLERELGEAPLPVLAYPGGGRSAELGGRPVRRRASRSRSAPSTALNDLGRRGLDGAEAPQRRPADDAGDPARAAAPGDRAVPRAPRAAPACLGAGMTFEPVWMGDLELSGPVADLEPPLDHRGAPYRHARLLVRVHGTPVALVHVDLREGRCPAASLVSRVREEAGRPRRRASARRRPARRRARGRRPARRSAEPPCAAQGPCPERAQGLASVIVCTRDRSESLRIALTSILASDRGDFEVVVVDNAPATDGDAPRRSTSSATPACGTCSSPRAGLSRARNRGALEARGGILAFTDDDMRVEPTWLEPPAARASRVRRTSGASPGSSWPPSSRPRRRRTSSTASAGRRCWRRAVYDLGEHGSDDPMYPFRAGRFGTRRELRGRP